MEAPWLFPTQNVTGVVELSTNTLRMFVNRGRRYSTNSPVLGFRRCTVSVNSPPDHASPFLSPVTSYGHDPGVGAGHSLNCSVLVSNIPMRSPRFSPHHRRPSPPRPPALPPPSPPSPLFFFFFCHPPPGPPPRFFSPNHRRPSRSS